MKAWLWGLLCLCHCGYQSLLPSQSSQHHRQLSWLKITVHPFRERRTIISIGSTLTAQLRQTMAAHGFQWQSPGESFDLLGDLDLFEQGIQSAAGIRLFRLQVRYQVQLHDQQGQSRWYDEGYEQEDYLLHNDTLSQPIFTESNRQLALMRIAEKLAIQITQRLLSHLQHNPPESDTANPLSLPPHNDPLPEPQTPQDALTPAE